MFDCLSALIEDFYEWQRDGFKVGKQTLVIFGGQRGQQSVLDWRWSRVI
jgi:hypothetical protein